MEKKRKKFAERIVEETEMKEKRDVESLSKKVKERIEKERTMKLSVKEGAVASVMNGFGDQYITPYALALNANNAQIGFLASFVGLLGPLSQIGGSKLMEKSSRRKIIVTFVALQALMWLPIIFLSLFFWRNIFVNYLPVILIIFYSLFAIFGSIAGPSWFSLMGDIVPEKIRGRYFGKRNKISGTVVLVTSLIASFFLDFFKTKGFLLLGFSIFFFFACTARLISAYMFSKHYYPKLKLKKGYYFSFFQFMKKAPSNNFGKFVISVALMYFSVYIAAPFFSVYMLKDLGFNYLTFTLMIISQSVFTLLTLQLWGKFSDKYGNRKILRIGSMIIPFVPILWLFSASPFYIAFVPQLMAGIGWAAFSLSSSNFIYDSVSVQRRGICIAYYSLMNGIGIFLGAALGGILAQHLTINFMNKFLFIFLISSVARFFVAFTIMTRIKEVRKVEKPKLPILPIFHLKHSSLFKNIIFEIAHEIKIKK